MTVETLFGAAFAESGHDVDATPAGWTFATQMSSSNPAAFVRDIRWAPSVTATGAYEWRVYSGHIGETRTLLDSGALGAYVAGGGWQTFTIPPVDVSGLNFMVAVRSADGDPSYAYATGKWPASSGSLSGPGASGGAFSTSGGTPDNGSTNLFMLDAGIADTASDDEPVEGQLVATGSAITATLGGRVLDRGQLVATGPAVTATLTGRTVVRGSLNVTLPSFRVQLGHSDAPAIPGHLKARTSGGSLSRDVSAINASRES